jgi:hypothetical protein
MYPEMDENNYYRGEVTSAHPSQATSSQIVKESGEVK